MTPDEPQAAALPTDRVIDRRAFLGRMAAMTAAASAGTRDRDAVRLVLNRSRRPA